MTQLSVGGVPEHFNLPWLNCIENGSFQEAGLDIIWSEYPGGTGAMCKDLRSENIDVAVILTEGIVRDIIMGNPSKILQYYVRSPLIWGIHVPPESGYTSLEDIAGKRYSISRYGSGSHLMAYVHAREMGWQLHKDQFVVSGGLHGAIKDLNEAKAEIFLWEKYTTHPYVKQGDFAFLDEFITPWPCFVVAARNDVIESHPEALKKMLDVLNQSCIQLKMDPNAASIVAKRYHQDIKDVEDWLDRTDWAYNSEMDPEEINKVTETLRTLGLIKDINHQTDQLIARL